MSSSSENSVLAFCSASEMADAVAGEVRAVGNSEIDRKGFFTLVVSGGKTPLGLFSRFANPDIFPEGFWKYTHIFWADERAVPLNSPDSNFCSAEKSFIKSIPEHARNIYPMIADELYEPGEVAEEYDFLLKAFFESKGFDGHRDFPSFDLILLGMGTDGHVASLFPESPALDETPKWVLATNAPPGTKPRVPRISLSLPCINNAKKAYFLISGKRKRSILKGILEGRGDFSMYPAAMIKGPETKWFTSR